MNELAIGNYGTINEDMEIRRGQDFVHDFNLVAGETFAVGTQGQYEIYGRDRETLLGVWPAADVAAATVRVQILAALLDSVPNGSFYTLYVQEPGYPRAAWYEGAVWRKGRT